jgi:hypothetical protein
MLGAPPAASSQEILTLCDARSALGTRGNAHLGKIVAAVRLRVALQWGAVRCRRRELGSHDNRAFMISGSCGVASAT